MPRHALPFNGGKNATWIRFATLAAQPPIMLYNSVDVVNLLKYWPGPASEGSKYDAWFPEEAASAAAELRLKMRHHNYTQVILFGQKVADAWGLPDIEWAVQHSMCDYTEKPYRLMAIPHPGGTNHWYNDKMNKAKVEQALRRIFP